MTWWGKNRFRGRDLCRGSLHFVPPRRSHRQSGELSCSEIRSYPLAAGSSGLSVCFTFCLLLITSACLRKQAHSAKGCRRFCSITGCYPFKFWSNGNYIKIYSSTECQSPGGGGIFFKTNKSPQCCQSSLRPSFALYPPALDPALSVSLCVRIQGLK